MRPSLSYSTRTPCPKDYTHAYSSYRRVSNGGFLRLQSTSAQDITRQYGFTTPKEEPRTPSLPIVKESDYETILGLRKDRLNICNTRSDAALGAGYPDSPFCDIRQTISRMVNTKDTPLSKDELRWVLRTSNDLGMEKAIRSLFFRQLQRCNTPNEILTLVAMALQHPNLADAFAKQERFICSALFRCREHVSDRKVLETLLAMVSRLELAQVSVGIDLVHLLVRFGARCRDLDLMYRALKKYKARKPSSKPSEASHFRSTIAKFSIGHRGLGAIRNGSWKKDDLLQVLTGFECEAHLPEHEKCHMAVFLRRDVWLYWHAYLAALGLCQASSHLWTEWTLWRDHYSNNPPAGLISAKRADQNRVWIRLWFIEQIATSGDVPKAWQILRETGTDFAILKDRVQIMLLSGISHAGSELDRVRQTCLDKYDIDIFGPDDEMVLRQASLPQVSKVIAHLLTRIEATGTLSRYLHDLPQAPIDRASADDGDGGDVDMDENDLALDRTSVSIP